MGTSRHIVNLLLALISIQLSACHPEIKTINFVLYEVSSNQISKYSSLRDLPFSENRFKGLPFYLIVKALAAKLNVSNVITKNWYSADVMKSMNSKIKVDEASGFEITIFPTVLTMEYNK